MKLDINCKVEIPNLVEYVEMTPQELLAFHNDLTKFINDNWEVLRGKDND